MNTTPVSRTLVSAGQEAQQRVLVTPRAVPRAFGSAPSPTLPLVLLRVPPTRLDLAAQQRRLPTTIRRAPRWSDHGDAPSAATSPADVQKLVVGMGLAALAVLLGALAWNALSEDPTGPKGDAGVAGDTGGAAGPILRTARRVIPCEFGTPLWDEILGGAIGPGRWKLYEKGYGTTCGVVVGYILEQAGADPRLINRGDRFKIGAHISRLFEGGKAIGALRMDAELAPGDVYCMLRDGGKPGVVPEHVGIVLERHGDELVTGDGGQTDEHGNQCARVVHRTLKGNRIRSPSGGATCAWRLSLGG